MVFSSICRLCERSVIRSDVFDRAGGHSRGGDPGAECDSEQTREQQDPADGGHKMEEEASGRLLR